MDQTVQAVYEGGVFKPLGKLELSEHEIVQLSVQTLGRATQTARWIEGGDDLLSGLHTATGIVDLAEHFGNYRFGGRRP